MSTVQVRGFSARSYRSIFKWGAPDTFYDVSERLRSFLVSSLDLPLERLKEPHRPGLDEVSGLPEPALSPEARAALVAIVGADNVASDDYTRARHCHGSTFLDLMQLRLGQVADPPDVVVFPRDEREVQQVVALCHERRVALVPSGGRTSVTRGLSARRGGVALSLARHMNQVLAVDQTDHVARVQPGMLGPAYEAYLNERGFTCGHFPQSFEYASVGGWVAARGAGQQSTYYGKAEDMVMALRCATPRGPLATSFFPRHAVGPDLASMVIGSEGAFGVITELTMRIWPHRPRGMLPLNFMFRSFRDGLDCIRTILQSGIGRPGVCRLSDPEETEAAFVLDGLRDGSIDRTLRRLGYRPSERALMVATTEGDRTAAVATAARAHGLALRHGALPLGPKPLRAWQKRRFHDPYLRDDLMDLGVLTDTLETAVPWSGIEQLWREVRAVIKARPNTVALTHLSHAYETGANLYFIFLSPLDLAREIEDYSRFHRDIVNAIVKNGGSLSHHHGVGRLLAPWIGDCLGGIGHGMLGAVKGYLDPHDIMNPGVLGLGDHDP